MAAYLRLSAYPEVPNVLHRLKDAGMQTAVLSNGSPKMLDTAVASAGIADYLDAVLSVEDVGIYKPDPRVYRLATDRFGVSASHVSFQSSNAWDAAAAANGFSVVWINRTRQPREYAWVLAPHEIDTLADLPRIVLGGSS
jgi:2-haloacid dehalogenase